MMFYILDDVCTLVRPYFSSELRNSFIAKAPYETRPNILIHGENPTVCIVVKMSQHDYRICSTVQGIVCE